MTTNTESPDAGAENVVAVPDPIMEFRADDTRVYWSTDSSRVKGCVFTDCEHTTVSYGTTEYGSLALGDHDLFWTPKVSTTTVLSCPKAGCAGAPTKVIQDTNLNPTSLTADGDYFYWPSAFDTYRCPASGCGDIPELVAKGELGISLQFAGRYAYWARVTYQGTDLQSPVVIRRAPKDGSEPPSTVLSLAVALNGSFLDFAADRAKLYWLDESSHVQSCALETCATAPPTTLVSTDTSKYSLQVDESGLYWFERGSSFGSGSVNFCSLGGCPSGPQPLTDDQVIDGNTPFLLSQNYVYWQRIQMLGDNSYTDERAIRRIRKPTP